MNRTDLVYRLTRDAKLTSAQAEVAISAFIDGIFEAIQRNESVSIAKLGSFSCVERREREGHNPKTGQRITIPSKRAIKFRPAKAFKEVVDGIGADLEEQE